MTDQDETDLAEAVRMERESDNLRVAARVLRRQVTDRVRQRDWRAKRKGMA